MGEKEQLRAELERLLGEVKKYIQDGFSRDPNKVAKYQSDWDEMVSKAILLHKIVKPKHHRYMIENRGCLPDNPEFYDHIHPIEDLLAYMDDPHANDDPEDQTIDHDFYLEVYSRRWGHNDRYILKRIPNGWFIKSLIMTNSGECAKDGTPYLYKNLEHDSINYPHALPEYLEALWSKAHNDGLSHDEVQEALNQLSKWIIICEKNTPSGIWEGY